LTKEGMVFGGYTQAVWGTPERSMREYRNNYHSFLFSLNLNKKYPIKNKFGEEAILCHDKAGPSFGLFDIEISNQSLTTSSKNYLYTYGTVQNSLEMNNNNRYFIAKEIEVYYVKEK
jgi:hypothetical protein